MIILILFFVILFLLALWRTGKDYEEHPEWFKDSTTPKGGKE